MPGTALYDGQGNLVATFGTIQQAVDAAQDGYTVQLADGTYREQVSVTDKTITIKGNGEGRTTIESPDATALNANTAYRGSAAYSIIGVKSSTRTTGLTIQNLTIDGRNQGSVGDSNGLNFDGIGGTNANISADSVAIQNVRKLTNGALNGNQRNTGIIVDNSDGAARTFSLTNSTVSAFQKNGLTLNGAGLTVNVRGNTITGAGATEALAQNGIQVSRGATGMIANNNLTGIDYTLGSLASQDQANSILAFGAGSNLAITNNTITGATDGNGQGNAGQVGIYFTDTDSGAVTGNTIKNMMPSIVETGSFTTPLQLNGNIINTTGNQNGYDFSGSTSNGTGYDVTGTAASDYFGGGGGNDTLIGLGGGDLFVGGAGNDVFYGNSTGADANTTGISRSTAEYTGPQSDYTVSQNTDGSFKVVNTGAEGEGADTLHGIDTVVFDGGGSIDLTAYPQPSGGGSSGSSGASTAPTPGPDLLNGTSGSDTIVGLAGGDTINGRSGNDLILGNQGDDSISDGDGNSTIAGGMDNDRITVGNGSNLLYGNEGADTISAGNGGNTIVGGQDSTDGADLITSGSGNDLILGNGGDDTVAAGGGADTVVGGFGRDIILGNQGDDLVLGNQGDDTLYGGQGGDTVVGGMGNDVLYGNEGDDVLYGNEGLNTFVFAPGDTDFKSGQSTGDTVVDFATGTSRIDFASGPAGTTTNFGATSTTSADFASIQALAQTLINGGDTYAFVATGTDGYLFTTGGTGTAITDAVKLSGAGSVGAVKYTDIAHGPLG